MEIGIVDIANLNKKLNSISKASGIVSKRTVSDIKKRAPSWVSECVTDVYNIKKADVNGTLKTGKAAGRIRVQGDSIKTLQLVYTGRLLTPTHFGMSPKSPPIGRSYRLTMQVKKGSKKLIGRYKTKRIANGPNSERSHNILMSTRTTRMDKVKYIPFQRVSKRRLDIKKFTTVSVPQMITNKDVSSRISIKLQDGLLKRYEHHIKQARKNIW